MCFGFYPAFCLCLIYTGVNNIDRLCSFTALRLKKDTEEENHLMEEKKKKKQEEKKKKEAAQKKVSVSFP